MRWGVEREKSCQTILSGTYKSCCFDDVMKLGSGTQNLFCTTHQQRCPLSIPRSRDRISAESFRGGSQLGVCWFFVQGKGVQNPESFQSPRNTSEHCRTGAWSELSVE